MLRLLGKNLFDKELEKIQKPSENGYASIPIYIGKGLKTIIVWSEKKLPKGANAFVCISREKNSTSNIIGWIYHSTSENLINNNLTFTTTLDTIYFTVGGDTKIIREELFNMLQIEISDTPTAYEPYREQSITLTSDRPITKWDKLVEQDGQIGWLYKSVILQNLHERGMSIHTSGAVAVGITGLNCKNGAEAYCNKLRYNNKSISGLNDGEFLINHNGVYIKNTDLTDVEQFKTWLASVKPIIATEAETAEFVPLPQDQQDAIRALSTYYPTTVVSNSEDMEMKLSYVADTKLYIDNKFTELNKALVNTQMQIL